MKEGLDSEFIEKERKRAYHWQTLGKEDYYR